MSDAATATRLEVEMLTDSYEDACGWYALGHWPKKQFIGACIKLHRWEYGDLDLLWKGKFEQAWWREEDRKDLEFPMWFPCKPDAPGAFAITLVRWEA